MRDLLLIKKKEICWKHRIAHIDLRTLILARVAQICVRDASLCLYAWSLATMDTMGSILYAAGVANDPSQEEENQL